jgi:hypothetical protein
MRFVRLLSGIAVSFLSGIGSRLPNPAVSRQLGIKGRKQFFSEEKNQKTFIFGRS